MLYRPPSRRKYEPSCVAIERLEERLLELSPDGRLVLHRVSSCSFWLRTRDPDPERAARASLALFSALRDRDGLAGEEARGDAGEAVASARFFAAHRSANVRLLRVVNAGADRGARLRYCCSPARVVKPASLTASDMLVSWRQQLHEGCGPGGVCEPFFTARGKGAVLMPRDARATSPTDRATGIPVSAFPPTALAATGRARGTFFSPPILAAAAP